jgi:hypothetical protein
MRPVWNGEVVMQAPTVTLTSGRVLSATRKADIGTAITYAKAQFNSNQLMHAARLIRFVDAALEWRRNNSK